MRGFDIGREEVCGTTIYMLSLRSRVSYNPYTSHASLKLIH
jgi:hypothetical protein